MRVWLCDGSKLGGVIKHIVDHHRVTRNDLLIYRIVTSGLTLARQRKGIFVTKEVVQPWRIVGG